MKGEIVPISAGTVRAGSVVGLVEPYSCRAHGSGKGSVVQACGDNGDGHVILDLFVKGCSPDEVHVFVGKVFDSTFSPFATPLIIAVFSV